MNRPAQGRGIRALAPARTSSAPMQPTAMDDDFEDEYDDEKDHSRCSDCKGTGWYIGFTERCHCPTCDGAGYL